MAIGSHTPNQQCDMNNIIACSSAYDTAVTNPRSFSCTDRRIANTRDTCVGATAHWQELLRSGVLELQDPLHIATRCCRQRDGAQCQRHEVQQCWLPEASDGVRLPIDKRHLI